MSMINAEGNIIWGDLHHITGMETRHQMRVARSLRYWNTGPKKLRIPEY